MIKRWWQRILRDFFAGCALIAGEIWCLTGNQPPSSPESMAAGAYAVADAMLKARGKE